MYLCDCALVLRSVVCSSAHACHLFSCLPACTFFSLTMLVSVLFVSFAFPLSPTTLGKTLGVQAHLTRGPDVQSDCLCGPGHDFSLSGFQRCQPAHTVAFKSTNKTYGIDTSDYKVLRVATSLGFMSRLDGHGQAGHSRILACFVLGHNANSEC